ncbi:cell wall metabolism sensor histidine kinase WalK [Eubacteriales bacterium OttesenSCG-928-N13]|nr:cell wall metabolism sensor histidine kinase WalK [Eubacteriales bacterium OttesenSCG-928-N13]
MVGEYLFAQKLREEQRVTEDMAARAQEPLARMDADALYALSVESARQYDGRVLLLDPYGVTVADSESEYNGRRMHLREVQEVLGGEDSAYGYYEQQSAADGSWLVSAGFQNSNAVLGLYAAPVKDAGKTIGALVFTSIAQDVYDNLSNIQRQMIMYMGLIALAVLLISMFISRIFTRPINELSQGIARMSQGDLTSRVAVRGHNEFSQLAEAFNSMCERLETVDQTRNQFVSNASHELKTPLSTMKIMLETLMYQQEYNPTMQAEFLGDINKEIDRLNLIINDLLTLVHFDSHNMELHPIKLQLDELLTTTVRRLDPLASSREIALNIHIVDEIETYADHMKLEQVFYNLVDNAIKYTPPGGEVNVTLTRANRKAIVSVEDSGIGIPKADVRHVFDRFYRVDKARARETGGTGLGLSIVKQIVMLHEGTITVSSEEDKGSTFTVELPIVNL